MKKSIYYLLSSLFWISLAACSSSASNESSKQGDADESLKNAYKDKFYIGVALNQDLYLGLNEQEQQMVKKHFNSIVAENDMKSEKLQPKEGTFFFDHADKFIEFGEKNDMYIIGHTLVWHSQAPRWFFKDAEGADVSREVLIERMKNHIQTVVTRYKGRVKGWDVVNEAILDDGEWRKSKFYEIIGEDFIPLAFQFAHEADPDAELYYNDYSMALEGRRNKVVELVKSLKEKGIRIDGVGMQSHIGLDGPSIADFEKSINAFSDQEVKVMITELDLTALPSPWSNVGANLTETADYKDNMNPYVDGLPKEVEAEWENRYLDFFKLLLKHSDKISRVTFWGLSDGDSWKNDFPINGRTDYPLLFDRNHEPKPIIDKLIEEAKKN